MKKSTAQNEPASNEKETHGQTSQVSEPSVFWFPVYEGLFEHAPLMGDAVWLFMWLIARTTDDGDGRGKVLGGIPVRDERPASELGLPVKTIRRMRRVLVDGDYTTTVRTPYGFRYTLLKSKKWEKPIDRDLPKRPISRSESAQTEESDLPLREVRVPLSDRESARSRKYKEDNTETTQGRLSGRLSARRPPKDLEGGGFPLPRPTPKEERNVFCPPDPDTLQRNLSSLEELFRCCERDKREPAKWMVELKADLEKRIATTHWIQCPEKHS